jgi:hypothetical protein
VRPDASGAVGDGVPGDAAGNDDGLAAFEDAQGEDARGQVEPDPRQRVELRRPGRQGRGSDVRRNRERLCAMPADAVERHDGVLVLGEGLGEPVGEAVGEDLHRVAVDRGQDQREDGLATGPGGAEGRANARSWP